MQVRVPFAIHRWRSEQKSTGVVDFHKIKVKRMNGAETPIMLQSQARKRQETKPLLDFNNFTRQPLHFEKWIEQIQIFRAENT